MADPVLISLIVLLPLAAAIIVGFGNHALGDRPSQLVTCLAVLGAAVLSLFQFYDAALLHHFHVVTLFTWMEVGDLGVDWSFKVDTLTAVMVSVITVVSSMVHIYSVGYMDHDESKPRFMAYLSLFTFCMLMLVTADNFVQMFFGWEGVGLASYLLIGFWYDRPSANAAAIKAFVVNRVSDFGFTLGILATFLVFRSVNFETVFAAVPGVSAQHFEFLGFTTNIMTVICILLFIGAMGKSAQLGLHTWLPDAMEGPTPVSALIHAATMVTAGVFMLCRLSPMFEYSESALRVVAVIGGSTAIFAASIGMAQNDIKRVIAYSTCSQLGYMFFAAGVSAYSAAMFHLMTHAFFKALLFLSAGSVIHAMSGEQDMRKMGGLWSKIPYTYAVMWIGSLALAGIPIFAGYYSKDMILEASWAAGSGVGRYAYWLGLFAAFLTAFYSWRLLIMTFHGSPRADRHVMEHVHESPSVMLAPLVVLAAGALFAGYLGHDWFVGEHRSEFWGASIQVLPNHDAVGRTEDIPGWVGRLPLIAGLLGILVAYFCYSLVPSIPGQVARTFRFLYELLLNKWYFDELYDRAIVKPMMALGYDLWQTGDGLIIDGLGPNGIAATTGDVARGASRLQTGYVYHYAFVMLIGLALLVSWYFLHPFA